ncbi:MAG TPA: amidohydrolase family protein, partial [Candidatus Limnocylindria bacterium]|nr:amidohydrolase family protein [Candidatus Limnocylindria bacterium]
MRTLIKGGTIVNADVSIAADVLVDGERIALIGQSLDAQADRTIDAAGKWVIPGAIDVHTHMELPFGGTAAKDTFETGTRAAAFGGTTTFLAFNNPGTGSSQAAERSLRAGLDEWLTRTKDDSAIDYAPSLSISGRMDDPVA